MAKPVPRSVYMTDEQWGLMKEAADGGPVSAYIRDAAIAKASRDVLLRAAVDAVGDAGKLPTGLVDAIREGVK